MRFSNTLTTTSGGLLYQATSTEVIDHISVQNTDNANHVLVISFLPGVNSVGVSTPILQSTILANCKTKLTGPINMQAGDSIIGSADANSLVYVQIP